MISAPPLANPTNTIPTRTTAITGFLQVLLSVSVQITWTTKLITENNIYFIATVPFYFIFTAFYVFYTINITYNIFAPKSWTESNTTFLSFMPQSIECTDNLKEKRVTVQIPVYTEDFENVIMKTLLNVLDVCRHYNQQNVIKMNIFINDDGLQVVDSKEKDKRIAFYNAHPEIFYIARPKEKRRGRFKKASNMNFCLNQLTYAHSFKSGEIKKNPESPAADIENKKSPKIHPFPASPEARHSPPPTSIIRKFSIEDETTIRDETERFFDIIVNPYYSNTNISTVKRTFQPPQSIQPTTPQIFKENILSLSLKYGYMYKHDDTPFELGNYILLLDCDSKITEYKMYELLNEFEDDADNKLAFLQMNTRTMYVENTRWEKTIGHFTDSIYNNSFLYSCAGGFPSPLVGHNCMLNWGVISRQYHTHPAKYTEYWDETKVSEDFVMSLKLQYAGYYGRYIYYDCGFEEGVTLNVVDEIGKFSKYAYGINELIFHPITKWTKYGICTAIFTDFIMNREIAMYVKYSILSYIGCYYSLAFSQLFAILNYYLWAWNAEYRKYMGDNLSQLVVMAAVFSVVGTVSNVVVTWKHAIKENRVADFAAIVWKNVYYSLFLTVFYSGLSFHFITVIAGHLLESSISWKTTNKEGGYIGLYDRIAQYKWMYVWTIGLLVNMGGMYFWVEEEWRIRTVYSIAPLLISLVFHAIMPVVL
jgi:hypothetical protein